MKILICDDEKELIEFNSNLIQDYLSQNKVNDYVITTFTSIIKAKKELNQSKSTYDIAILDIDFGESETGFEFAGYLQAQYGENILIIFLTSYDEYVFNSFEYRPFYFIRKHVIKEELPLVFEKACIYIKNKEQQNHLLNTLEGPIKVHKNKILYFEKINRKVHIVIDEKRYESYYTLTELLKEFEPYGFVMTHQSIIVNIARIESIKKDCIILDNKEMLPLSRHRVKEVKTTFNKLI